jgi:hypothetical protein
VDTCRIPIIAAYTGFDGVTDPLALKALWPPALAQRINNGAAQVIHIPFKRPLIDNAMGRFTVHNLPGGSLVHYTREGHAKFGISW